MRKVAVVSAFQPLRDNRGGPTGLPYQILKHAPEDCAVALYHFDWPPASNAQREKDDPLALASVTQIPFPSGLPRRYYFRRAWLRGLPTSVGQFPENREIIARINAMQPDLVWLYPCWLLDWLPGLRCRNVVVTGPDSVALHSERAIRHGGWRGFDELTAEWRQFRRNIALERRWGGTRARVHLVGEADVAQFRAPSARPEQCRFLPYSYSDYVPLRTPLGAESGKTRILITGGGRTIYVGDALTRLADALGKAAPLLAEFYEFSLLGTGYEAFAGALRDTGYTVQQADWVESYAQTLASAQIQIFPIAVGTGTKGKVLNALATGLLGIGTPFAFENIAVSPGEDCLLYRDAEMVPLFLEAVLRDKPFYKEMAARGADKVRQHHSPAVTSAAFWEWALPAEGLAR